MIYLELSFYTEVKKAVILELPSPGWRLTGVGMRYWAYFVAKLIAVLAFAYGTGKFLFVFFPRQVNRFSLQPFMHDLPYTLAVMIHFLICAGLMWLVVWDQRYRCRTCLRKLRMPVIEGGWHHVLLGPPRTDYICPFGHGTLRVTELNLSGGHQLNWERHDDDIWKELYALEDSRK